MGKTADRHSILFTAIASVSLVWLNAYWCREVFFWDHFGQMQSIRGFWEGLARLGHFSWAPQWWPYSYNGMPLELAYAPGVPALIAAVSKVTGWPGGRAFGAIAGFTFCFGPVALFWMVNEVTRRRWWSFIAALAYSLLSPCQLLVPDEFRWGHLGDPRRMMLIFTWDEVPHQLSLALILVAVLYLVRGLRGKRFSFWTAAALLGLAMLTSPFGGVLAAVILTLVWLSWKEGPGIQNAAWVAGCWVVAYLAVCPLYPPSVLRVIRLNANLASDSALTAASLWALLAVALGTALLLRLSWRWPVWYLRFFLLAAFFFFAVPFLGRWNLHFLPQVARYKVELDAVIAMLGTFLAALLLDRARPSWRAALALVVLIPAAFLVRSDRRYAKTFLRESDIRQTIEYQVASWLDANRSNQRVMAPGSIAVWMNTFTTLEQFTGGAWTTIPTVTMQTATWGVPHLDPARKERDVARLWLQAYGVDALVVPGRESPEFWKPFEEPVQFEELFPLLWRQRDTSIYSVPRTYRSLVSFVPEDRTVRHRPVSFFQLDEIRKYVDAEEAPESRATWQWLTNNSGVVRGDVPRGFMVSLHITYHPGWKAFVKDEPAPVLADGLEQMLVLPNCMGPCEIKLTYDGGLEARLTRLTSAFTVIAAVVAGLAYGRWNRSGNRSLRRSLSLPAGPAARPC